MDKKKRAKLEAKGIRVTDSPAEVLGISPGRMILIDLRLNLGAEVRRLREASALTQAQLAELVGTKQPAIARMEHGNPSVALDRFIVALSALGATVSVNVDDAA